MMKSLSKCFLLFFGAFIFFSSCKKDTFITSSDASIFITSDSIKFDTVFTSTGSITQSFKIINENDQQLKLSSVKMMGGANSSFRININGNQVLEENDINIAANDSIYIFVSVYVDQSTANLPFIISDSILINYNNNNRFVQLQAYGQNAHFLNNVLLTGNNTWPNDLPYVILNGLRIDTTATLIIQAGCKIYSHANAPFIVDGSLQVNGVKDNEVQFRGDRLDNNYKDLPASWPGIYFRGNSFDNNIKFAKILNANQAVVVEDPSINSNPKLKLTQCIIDNAFEVGLFAYNTSIETDNSLISNCGNNLIIQLGGNYSFTNCTVAGYSTTYLLHTNPVLQVSNATFQNGSTITANLDANFTNCIFWGDYGSVDDEVSMQKEGANTYNVTLQNCLYKALNDPANTILTSVIKNIDPSFDSIDISNKYYDFRITKNEFAPGINIGTIVAQPSDLDGLPRSVGLPDLGSYEKQ